MRTSAAAEVGSITDSARCTAQASGGLFGLGGGGGAVLLDIREEEKFELGHAKGAVNVPLYVVMVGAPARPRCCLCLFCSLTRPVAVFCSCCSDVRRSKPRTTSIRSDRCTLHSLA